MREKRLLEQAVNYRLCRIRFLRIKLPNYKQARVRSKHKLQTFIEKKFTNKN
jgi:hypothetical protein